MKGRPLLHLHLPRSFFLVSYDSLHECEIQHAFILTRFGGLWCGRGTARERVTFVSFVFQVPRMPWLHLGFVAKQTKPKWLPEN